MTEQKSKPSIFISYAHKDTGIVDKLKLKLYEKGFEVLTDELLLSYKGAIYDFLKSKNADVPKYFIILISDNYLKSEHCMFEFREISRNFDHSNYCFNLIKKETNIFSTQKRLNFIHYWDEKINRIEFDIKGKAENSNESNLLFYNLNTCYSNKNQISNLFNVLTNMYTFEIGENVDEIINIVIKALETKSKIDNQKSVADDEK